MKFSVARVQMMRCKNFKGNFRPPGLLRPGKDYVFDEVVNKEGKSVALAAYQSGTLAEGRLDYFKAMRQYKKAAVLEEDNPEYLLAAGIMARTLGDYRQAQDWLEKLLEIRQGEKEEGTALASALHNLAWVYESQGRYGEAEPLYKRSLKIFREVFPGGHPNIKIVQDNYEELRLKNR